MAKQAALNEVRPVLNAADAVLDKVEGAIDTVEEVADKGIDIAEDVLESGVHATAQGGRFVVRALRSPKTTAVVVLVATGVVAGYVGYKLASVRLTHKFEKELAAEVETTRDFYARLNKADEFSTPEKAAAALGVDVDEDAVVVPLKQEEAAKALKSYQGKTDYTRPISRPDGRNEVRSEPIEEDEPVKANVFVDGKPLDPDEFDYDTEARKRTPDEPYVISHEEFVEGKDGYHQITFTYYEADDTLTNEKDEPIDNVEATVGSDNLAKFGYGSHDPNVVYVRNEAIELDFEVTRSQGSFATEVMGFGEDNDRRGSQRAGRRSGDDG